MKGAHMQGYAVSIELELRQLFDCDRFSMGGFINSDHIRSTGFISSIVLLLSTKYTDSDNRKIIDEFLEDIIYYDGKRMDDLDEEIVEDILDRLHRIRKQFNL